ncbi:MAG: leucine-rich repeat domain-containing protein, partial [Kiritimatiellaeota bacterium]|nr:leucine-rich repeat domain-containing protein [Kiritimatiellota bacterium]
MKNMKDTIRIMTAAAALLGAHAAHAQSWTYSPSPTPRISHPDTWVFEVSANGNNLTVTNCLAAPTAPGVLPFVDPVGGGYRIVGITGAMREGGVLGERHERAASLTLPDTLTDIGEYAFCGCLSLSGILVIPPGVTSIGGRAFYDTGLTGITTPSSGVTFGGGAFAENPFLDTVYYIDGYPASVEEDLYEGSEGVTSYVLPANAPDWDPHVGDGPIAEGLATWLGQPISSRISWTFSDPTLSAPRITHPLGWVFAVTVNGADLTVTNCLASPPIPGPGPLPFADPVGDGSYRIVGIPGTGGTAGVLGAHALKVDFLTLPDALTAIGNYAFYSCTALKGDLAIPDAVTAIGDMAFANTRLSEIVVPSTGLSLGDAAFAYNPSLMTVLYTGAYPDFVGTDLYLNSYSSVSFIMSSHEASWTPHVTSPPISSGGAAWQGRTIALYGWGFADSPPRIIHPLGWVFAVTVSGNFLTVTDCLAAPATPGPLP